MDFARRVFTWAGLYGLVIVTPLYLAEPLLTRLYGPLTYPVWFYGFLGVVIACQLVYLQIGRDPVRFRPMMPLMILAKVGFGATALILFALHRAQPLLVAAAMPDLVWAGFFAAALRRTPVG